MATSSFKLGLLLWAACLFVAARATSETVPLKRAVELAPRYPENRLNLIEAYLKWGEPNNARRELAALEDLWPGARANFVGEAWAASWADWEARLNRLRKKIQGSAKGHEARGEKS